MEVVAALVAERQTAEGVQPGEGALDRPAPAAQAGAVRCLAAGDAVCDAALAQQAPVLVMVIATVGDDQRGAVPRPAGAPGDVRDAIQERQQLGHVVAVAGRGGPRQGQAASVHDQVVLGPAPPAIDRARARRGAPFLACTWLPSTHARDQSI